LGIRGPALLIFMTILHTQAIFYIVSHMLFSPNVVVAVPPGLKTLTEKKNTEQKLKHYCKKCAFSIYLSKNQ